MSAPKHLNIGEAIGDIAVVVRALFEDGPTIRAAIVKAANDPEIVAGWNAGLDAINRIVAQLKIGSTAAPAPRVPPIPIQQGVDAVQVGADPAGPGNPQI